MTNDTGSRRRGQELEEALLTAAWDELAAVGYVGFTVEAVAERARTSRPVLYRRWPNRSDLALAAIRHHGQRDPVAVPDTGNVRDDLVALLRTVSERRTEVAAMISVQMAQYFAETGATFADLRERLMAGREQPFALDVLLRRGVERGEIDGERLTARIRELPTDLLRHEMLMTLRPVDEETVHQIVDDIFLPLVRPAGTQPARHTGTQEER